MEKLIEINNLRFTYPPDSNGVEKEVLKDISLDIEKGSFVAVIGSNGSGKSTFAKQLNGLLLPTSGTVKVNGIDTKDQDRIWDVRQNVGMVFQNPDNQIVSSIVEDDVAFGPENLGVEAAEIRQRVDDALESVRMGAYKMKSPHMLSGGQKQRIAIAGAVAMKPQCIVFDEPTAMLDPNGREEVMKTIKLLKEKGITIVLITHYMDEAVLADRVIVMEKGEILLQGEPEKVFSQVQLLKQHSLDVPQSTELSYKLIGAGLRFSKMPLNTRECVNLLKEALK